MEPSYPEAAVENHAENCEDHIQEIKMEIKKQIYKKIRDETDNSETVQCMIDDLRSKHWLEEFMLKMIYQASLTLSAEEKEAKLASADATIKKTVKNSIYLCVFFKNLEALFDSIMNNASSSSEEADPTEDYCARKLVVDNKLIDTTKYNVILNPNNLDISAVNCEQVLEKAFKTSLVTLTKIFNDNDDFNLDDKKSQCIFNKYHEQHYVHKDMRVRVLRKLDISAETKLEEKNAYIQRTHDLFRMIKECK